MLLRDAMYGGVFSLERMALSVKGCRAMQGVYMVMGILLGVGGVLVWCLVFFS